MHTYPPRSVCEPNMVSLLCMVIEKLTLSQEFDINLTKSVDHGRHVPSMSNVWIKLHSNRETDLITKT